MNVEANGPGTTQGLSRYHTEPVEGCEEPRIGCSQVASRGRAQEPHSRAPTRMTAKFFTKMRRSGSTSKPSSKDTKQTVPWPRVSIPMTTASGARRRQRSSITPSSYTLRQKRNRLHRCQCAAEANQGTPDRPHGI